jgi:hypothetical protein
VLDNALTQEPDGDCGLVSLFGVAGLSNYMGDPSPLGPRFYGNVMYVPSGERLQTFPLHNYVTPVPFTYAAPVSGDYQLLSPLWTDTTDGKLSGINWSVLQAAKGGIAPGPLPPVPSAGGAVPVPTPTPAKTPSAGASK